MKNKYLIPVLGLVLSGCTTLGESDFGCSGLPQGVSCTKASELYNEVDKRGYEPSYKDANSPKASETSGASTDSIGRRQSGAADLSSDTRNGEPAERYFGTVPEVSPASPDQLFLLNPPKADSTQPRRISAKLREIWVAPWVDADGIYHSDQTLFVDIKPSSWRNGEISVDSSPIFSPLK